MVDKKNLARIKTAVLCGGPGVEREVSLNSGESVYAALAGAGFDVEKAVVPEAGFEAFLNDLDCQVAVMMLHGEFGEDGRPQALLEKRGIPFTGPDAAACRIAIDKDMSKQLFRQHSVPTADWVVVESVAEAGAKMAEAGLAAPVVVKPNSLGSSVGVAIVRAPEDLEPAVTKALAVDPRVMIEPFMPGRELTIGWLDGNLLPIIELVPDGTFYDYNAKYISDKTEYRCPAELDPGDEAASRSAAENVLKIVSARDLSRVDIILGPSGPMVLEVNTSPGFTSHSLVPLAARRAGIAMEDLCARLVEMAARRGGLL